MRGQLSLLLRVTALLVLVGCGDVVKTPDASETPDPNALKSGTRLKIRWYDYGGGTRSTSGLFDAQRNESCFSTTWADGKIYCVPSDTGQAVYTDKQCTQLASLVSRSTCGKPPPAYLIEYASTACTTTAKRLFQRGPQLAATPYYVHVGGTCEGPLNDADASYYLPGTEVPVTQLVEFSLAAPDHTVRISAPAYTSADGARFRTGMYDSELETRCFVSSDYAGAGTAVCVPSPAPDVNYFRDATCTLPVVDEDKRCPVPQFAQMSANNNCPLSPTTYYRVGASVALQAAYAGGAASCSVTTPSPDSAFYVLGAAVAPAQVSRVRDPNPGGGLQVIRYVSGTMTFRDGSLYDNQLGAECRSRLLADGSYRCIPSSDTVLQFYTNATCTTAIDLVQTYSGPASCGAGPLPTYAAKPLPPAAGSCVSGLEMYSVGAEYTGPLFQNFSGTCATVSTVGYHYYRLGAKHALTEFKPATLVTDP
jgi:hypothetical protein